MPGMPASEADSWGNRSGGRKRLKSVLAALFARRQHRTLAMTKRRAPCPFKEAQDTASAEEGARLLLAEFGRTVDVLQRHHALEAISVVIVRDPILQRQTAVLVQHIDGLAGMLDKYKIRQTASTCAAEHIMTSEARALERVQSLAGLLSCLTQHKHACSTGCYARLCTTGRGLAGDMTRQTLPSYRPLSAAGLPM